MEFCNVRGVSGRVLVMAALSCITLEACVVARQLSYPHAWPELARGYPCGALSGTYLNRAVADAGVDRYLPPEGAVYWLSEVFVGEWHPGPRPNLIRTVTITVTDTRVQIVADRENANHEYMVPGTFEGQCDESGTLIVRFDTHWSGDDSFGRGKVAIFLAGAKDGSLIVHREAEGHIQQFILIPERFHNSEWARFRRAGQDR